LLTKRACKHIRQFGMPIYRLSPMLNSLSHLLTCSGCSTCWLPFPCRMCVASDSAIDLCPDSVLAVNLLVVKPRNLHDYCACLLTATPLPPTEWIWIYACIYIYDTDESLTSCVMGVMTMGTGRMSPAYICRTCAYMPKSEPEPELQLNPSIHQIRPAKEGVF